MGSPGTIPIGTIEKRDALCDHLVRVVLPRAGLEVTHPEFELSPLGRSQAVRLCLEQKSRNLFVCKFFGERRQLSEQRCRELLNYEWVNLNIARKKGLERFPHRVVRPLSRDEQIKCLLVEDYARGHDLDYYIVRAAYEGQHEALFEKLTELAHFLAKLHTRTANTVRINFTDATNYFGHLVDSLAQDGLIDAGGATALRELCGEWERVGEMWRDVTVLVHGDVTPTNFIFHPQDGITAIDLERMRSADRVYDVGALAAELKHHFAWRILQADVAEPFIWHFLRAYCDCFSDSGSMFDSITRRNQFYMALAELRIARNDWLPWEHRTWLTDEACRCLQL